LTIPKRGQHRLIDRLSHDEHPGVRTWVAGDTRLSQERLLELLEDPETAAAAAADPNPPVELMVAILDAPMGWSNAQEDAVLLLVDDDLAIVRTRRVAF
jgi:hypothetical protein